MTLKLASNKRTFAQHDQGPSNEKALRSASPDKTRTKGLAVKSAIRAGQGGDGHGVSGNG
jgi:hypothetical protein